MNLESVFMAIILVLLCVSATLQFLLYRNQKRLLENDKEIFERLRERGV